MSYEEIRSLVLALKPEQRLHLMDELSESLLSDDSAAGLTGEQLAELDRRLAHSDAHPEELIPFDEVVRRLGNPQ